MRERRESVCVSERKSEGEREIAKERERRRDKERENSFKVGNAGQEREVENIFCMRMRMSNNNFLEI